MHTEQRFSYERFLPLVLREHLAGGLPLLRVALQRAVGSWRLTP